VIFNFTILVALFGLLVGWPVRIAFRAYIAINYLRWTAIKSLFLIFVSLTAITAGVEIF